MQFRKLTLSEIHAVYKSDLFQTAFPRAEIRPWGGIQKHIAAGRYPCYGWFDDQGHLCTYAFCFACDDVLLLDYLASTPRMRGKGQGGAFLQELNAQLGAPVLGEVEALTSKDPDENALRRRRMGFYNRNGFALRGVRTRVYGVDYRIIANAAAALYSDDQLAEVMRRMYPELLHSALRTKLHVKIWTQPVDEL